MMPRSIAGRTTLVLLGGLILVLAATALASFLILRGGGSAGPGNDALTVDRISGVASVIERLPPEQRSAVAEAAQWADSPNLSLAWVARPVRLDNARMTWRVHRLERFVERRLAASGTSLSFRAGEIAGDNGRDHLVVAVPLNDGTWLEGTVPITEGLPALVRIIAALGVAVGGLLLLATVVARRVIRPLDDLSLALDRFSNDVDAPALPEAGPREVRAVAVTFNRMRGRIQRLVSERTLMLAAISHDLRTVLTRLHFRAEFIGDEIERTKALADIEEMRAMLDATLAFARDDAVREQPTALDLTALVESVSDDFADEGADVAVVDAPPRLVITARPVALRRAVANIVRNAVLYAGSARVSLGRDSVQGLVTITVVDHGPGIPVDQREQVFTPFYRLEASRNRETGGTGLGLTIARNAIISQGGTLTLDETPGGGLTVQMTVPADTAGAERVLGVAKVRDRT